MKRGRKPVMYDWTEEIDADIVTLTLEEVHQKYGIPVTTTKNRRTRLGIIVSRGPRPTSAKVPTKPRTPHYSADRLAGLVALIEEAGGSIAAVARRIGVSTQAISSRIESARRATRLMRGPQAVDLHGHRFGRLLAIMDTGLSTDDGTAIWLCKCRCKKAIRVPVGRLTAGDVESCGCHLLDKVALASRPCPFCESTFSPKSLQQVCCSPDCQREREAAKQRLRANERYWAKKASESSPTE